jgi:hypothetical protein
VLDEPLRGWARGTGALVWTANFEDIVTQDEVRVRTVRGERAEDKDRFPMYASPKELDLGEVFGMDWSRARTSSVAVFSSGLPSLLGYTYDDVRFRWAG